MPSEQQGVGGWLQEALQVPGLVQTSAVQALPSLHWALLLQAGAVQFGGVPQGVAPPQPLLPQERGSATHCDWAWQLAGVQVRVCGRWVDAQPPVPQAPGAPQPLQEQPGQLVSGTHCDWAWQLAGVQVRVCGRWVDAQPPVPQAPGAPQPLQEQAHGGHGPPQSTPVSPWFWMPSEQVGQLFVVQLVEQVAGQGPLAGPLSHCSPPLTQLSPQTSVKQSSGQLHRVSQASQVVLGQVGQTLLAQEVEQVAGQGPFAGPLSHCSGGSIVPLPQVGQLFVVQLVEQVAGQGPFAGPSSHCSPLSRIPLPHWVTGWQVPPRGFVHSRPGQHGKGLTNRPQPWPDTWQPHSQFTQPSPGGQESPAPPHSDPQGLARMVPHMRVELHTLLKSHTCVDAGSQVPVAVHGTQVPASHCPA